MLYKTIIQGRLTFSNKNSFDKVFKMYEYRAETYYKSDLLLKQEDIFDETALTLSIPRYVGNTTEKCFRNTVSLIEYCAQFAVSGSIDAWMIDEGKVISSKSIEPASDKAVVIQFKKGDRLFKEGGKESEALEAFNKTLEKFDKHAQAYERRGWINLKLKNYSDALYDFNKAIKLDESIAFSYYGKALIAENENNLEAAIENYELTIKKSVALQSLYWKSRYRKAQCHMALEEWGKAAFDLKFFTNRKFAKSSSNNRRKPHAYFLYGKVLIEMSQPKEALEAFEKSFLLCKDIPGMDLKEIYYYRGLAKKLLGKKDFKSDLLKASEQGSVKAKEYLIELA
jgi:tetratricopeptide (TPR) repeat protein